MLVLVMELVLDLYAGLGANPSMSVADLRRI